MKLKELLQKAGLNMLVEESSGEIEITGITSNSRRVKRGELFVALRGLSFDGTQYVADAFLRGAAFIISERAFRW